MTGTNVGTAYLEIIPSAKGFAGKLQSEVAGDMTKVGTQAGAETGKRYASGFKSALKGIAGAIGATLAISGAIGFLHDANDEARESIKVGNLTTQVIKSTGGAANVTAKEFGDLATAISNKIGVDDEQIQAGENLLATFTNVRNEVGRGNKIFNQATRASVDLAASLAAASGGQINLRSSTTLVGKALNDPIKGLTALTRVGVAFTDQQKTRIKGLVTEGHTLQAQKIILGELRKEFGGAAASQATASDKLKVSIKNLEEQIGLKLLPYEDKLATAITTKVIPATSEFIDGMENGTGKGGEFANAIKHDIVPMVKGLAAEATTLYGGLKPVLGLLNSLPGPVKTVGLSVGILSSQFAKFGPQLPSTATGFERVGAGIRNLAGAGGLLAVADSANRSSKAVGGLEGAVGGAVTAFAATGNPIAALIGAAGGGLLGIFSSGKKAADGLDEVTAAVRNQKVEIDGYKTTLKGLQAQITGQTRSDVLKNIGKGRDNILQGLEATDKQILNAATGRSGAYQAVLKQIYAPVTAAQKAVNRQTAEVDRLNRALADAQANGTQNEKLNAETARNNGEQRLQTIKDQLDATTKLSNAQKSFVDSLSTGQTEQRKTNAELLTYNQLVKLGVPKPIAHIIDTKGVQQDTTTVAGLIDKFNIVDKTKWKAIIKAEGLVPTDATLKEITQLLHDAAKDRTAKLTIKVAGDVAMAAALGAFGGGNTRVTVPDYSSTNGSSRTVAPPASIYSPAPAQTSTSSTGRMRLVVGAREFDAYVDDRADNRVYAAQSLDGEAERAGDW